MTTQTAEQVKNTVMPMIKKSLSSLNDGISQLVGGSSELSRGVAQFDNEGIQPLYRLVNDDLRGMADKINRLGELANIKRLSLGPLFNSAIIYLCKS